MLKRLGVALAGALVGAVALGMLAGVLWLLVFEDAPPGGTGNSATGDVVFGWGMLGGAAIGFGGGLWFTREPASSPTTESRLAKPAAAAAVLSVLLPLGIVVAAASVLVSSLALRRSEPRAGVSLALGVLAAAYCALVPPLFTLFL